MRYRHIVILTGAGISAESGLATFRAEDGLWENHRVEDVATPEGFARDPAQVHAFYNARRRAGLAARPNPGHTALARLERESQAKVLIVTQNIDTLHEQAGSRNVIHMHGELGKSRCTACRRLLPCEGDIGVDTPCPACGSAGTLRPHVVWFGEMPLELERIYGALAGCDLFLSIGTSGNVYPAAGFIQEVRAHGFAHTVEVNLEPSLGAHYFNELLTGPAGTTLPAYVDGLLGG
jgi:NAD-dependent deacetylase